MNITRDWSPYLPIFLPISSRAPRPRLHRPQRPFLFDGGRLPHRARRHRAEQELYPGSRPAHYQVRPSVRSSGHQSVNPSVHQSISPFISPSVRQSISPSVHQSISQSFSPWLSGLAGKRIENMRGLRNEEYMYSYKDFEKKRIVCRRRRAE